MNNIIVIVNNKKHVAIKTKPNFSSVLEGLQKICERYNENGKIINIYVQYGTNNYVFFNTVYDRYGKNFNVYFSNCYKLYFKKWKNEELSNIFVVSTTAIRPFGCLYEYLKFRMKIK